MRAVVQRVKEASVTVDGVLKDSIKAGLLVFVGVEKGDGPEDIKTLTNKVLGLRIFEDIDGKMNLSVLDTGGELLMVSQFTLLADARKGRRPSFNLAEVPQRAKERFDQLVVEIEKSGLKVGTGQFQEMMDIGLVNDGPVTILLDSRKNF
jgi:D-tyrosyl-tRNA(Tyr) deacylase